MDEAKKIPNAKKWTNEVVAAHLYAMEEEIKKPGVYLLRQVLGSRGLKKHVWSYWNQTLEDDLREHMARIESKLEAKIFEAGLRRELPSGMAIWLLKFVNNWNAK